MQVLNILFEILKIFAGKTLSVKLFRHIILINLFLKNFNR